LLRNAADFPLIVRGTPVGAFSLAARAARIFTPATPTAT
jgi:hypothetical protein